MDELFTVEPASWLYYLFTLLSALFVRGVVSVWRGLEIDSKFTKKICRIFKGIGCQVWEGCKPKKIAADYWMGFVLGLLELLAYPLLLRTNHPALIGAWLVFKTAHRWSYAPRQERGTYNRYLVGNALILVFSYFLARFMFDPVCRMLM